MASFGLHNYVRPEVALDFSAYTVTTTGNTIDTKGFESVIFVFVSGPITLGEGSVTLEQSPDDGTGSPTGVWTAIPAEHTIGALPAIVGAGDANKVFRVGSIGKERFQRVIWTEDVAFSSFFVGCTAVLCNPKSVPTAENTA
jgi:hypothetical protein